MCPLTVKLKLFRSYCICMYDVALWSSSTVAMYTKLSSCYTKCTNTFFGYCKYRRPSVTLMPLELRLSSFNTLIHNTRLSFKSSAL